MMQKIEEDTLTHGILLLPYLECAFLTITNKGTKETQK